MFDDTDLEVYDESEHGQADPIDIDAWRARRAVEGEIRHQRDRRGDPQ
jgi:hypothetical protein